ENGPVVGIGSDPLGVSETADGEQDHPPPTAGHRVGDRKRQAAATADDCQRTCIRHTGPAGAAHGSSPTWARRTAMVNGREPDRTKATTLATRGSSELCATASTRSRNVPAPKNMAS